MGFMRTGLSGAPSRGICSQDREQVRRRKKTSRGEAQQKKLVPKCLPHTAPTCAIRAAWAAGHAEFFTVCGTRSGLLEIPSQTPNATTKPEAMPPSTLGEVWMLPGMVEH